ncbi:exported hypothetical protein [Thiomonas sp. X19]|nr:exported hypothetical protein [Thiomonas sp. X19]
MLAPLRLWHLTLVVASVAKFPAIVAADPSPFPLSPIAINVSDLCAHWDVHGNVQVWADDRVVSTLEVLQRGAPQSLPSAADRVERMARDPAYRFAILALVHGCVQPVRHAEPPAS